MGRMRPAVINLFALDVCVSVGTYCKVIRHVSLGILQKNILIHTKLSACIWGTVKWTWNLKHISSEKPSKLRCIQTTSTEMGDSASVNPGNHCYIDSRKADSHSVHNSDPTSTRTRTYICLPLPQPVVTPPTPSGHSPSHWLRHFPTTTPSGINTPHVPSQSFFIHLPMKMGRKEGSETSAIRTKTSGNYPKENILLNDNS